MSKFNRFDVAETLGITPICAVSDGEIWERLVTPMTKGLTGPIVRVDPPVLVETTAGAFPGDEVSNLNDHRLYGGKAGFVRNRYIRTFHKTLHGAFIVKRDGVKIEAFCWSGDVEHGKGELILKLGMRDRRFDGTPRANDSALLDYGYDDPVMHKPISPDLKAVELSVYAFMPGSRVADVTGEEEFDRFIKNPFSFLDRPELFLAYFKRAWKTKRGPGQHAAPITDVSKLALPEFERIAKARGYDVIEGAPSHYHVARWFQTAGYVFTVPAQAATFAAFTAGLEKIRHDGMPLTRTQQSWVCVVQSLRPVQLIPEGLYWGGPLWPQTNMDNACLWMHKAISAKAKDLLTKTA
ncbi:MAG TPA: hypothetical protein V6C81_02860 [Planktothrix sp.]|jgi:hypothetical protein